ncbi:glycosyltransferase family 1 protein [Nonomuraea sp. FMUSA5-5]|uniref:Glycosyltransferase family 1 protein n=2 Tax=Nonomuraea composti TaxID=2720023 RepID=A0ABX1BTB7_9ACTN|nr:glycosyltransferase family 1 protein [Nonomuraea sp. FMUSA5-5]
MRVLCTVTGSRSHIHALRPLARALADAGHGVLIATTAGLAQAAATAGPPHVLGAVGLENATGAGPRVVACLPDLQAFIRDSGRSPGPPGRAGEDPWPPFILDMLAGLADVAGPALLAVAEGWRPDVIVRDGMDLAGILVAERLGVPHLSMPSGTANVLPPASVLPALNRLRAAARLPTCDDPRSVAPRGRLDYVPEHYSFARHRIPALRYRQPLDRDPAAVLPAWVTGAAAGRPLVYAAIGSTAREVAGATRPSWTREIAAAHESSSGFPHPERALRALIEGLSLLPCTAVVATGGVPLGDIRAAPHVHLAAWVPQPLLLECADLFVTHGGYNSVREAMRTATPMVVLPLFGDQPHNARRVAELRLGRQAGGQSGEAVAAACRAVLSDRSVQVVARAARLAMLTLPGVEQAVADLERLVREG